MKELGEKRIKKGIALGDIHHPFHNKKAVKIAFDFIKDFKPDYLVLGGDQMDFNCISYFNRNKPKLIEGTRLKKDYNKFQKDILNPLDNILPKKCERYWIEGNHEYRVELLSQSSPQMEGLVEPENNLDLSRYNMIGYNKHINFGKLYIIHGDHYNIHFAKKNLQEYNTNIFCFHTHKLQCHSKCSPVDKQPKVSYGVPCMCNLNPLWMRNRPSSWMNGFLIFYILPNNNFFFEIPLVIGGKSIIQGRLYS